jgi:hypothetical protein
LYLTQELELDFLEEVLALPKNLLLWMSKQGLLLWGPLGLLGMHFEADPKN